MQGATVVINVDEARSAHDKALQRQVMDGTGSNYEIDLSKNIHCVLSVRSKIGQRQQKKYIMSFQLQRHRGCDWNGII
jgi:hypothetical protein